MTLLRTYRRPIMQKRSETDFSDIFNRFFNEEKMDPCQYFAIPPANISENEDNFIIELAVPGYEKKDFNLELNENILTLSLNKNLDENKEYVRKEFQFNEFRRKFKLSDKVDKENITGHYKNGLLVVSIPKKKSSTKVNRSIKIE
ncbi:MAG: Hsp20/alpha crystallin family protein [Bacteroidales bacterium]